ncbi:hypothetical protein DBR11_04970 [Pedobacter sp. HMWF019]|nr:hypothetical protein DBR11_04970 [Pedobacter sp. HMWF019]
MVGAIYWIALNYSHSHKVAAGGVLGITAVIGFARALMAGRTYIYVLDRNRIREEKIIYIKLMREIKRKKAFKKKLKEWQKRSKMSIASFS